MHRLLWIGLVLPLFMAAGCTVAPVQNITGQTRTPVQNSTEVSQSPTPVPTPETRVFSQEASQITAINFLQNSRTFSFDGIQGTLKLTSSEAGAKPGSWTFHYTFQNRQPGYGDRTGLMLAQVITSHTAEIVVEQGRVTSAVLDGKWDELQQKIIQ